MNISDKELDALLEHRTNPSASEKKPHPQGSTPSRPGVVSDADCAKLQSAVFGMNAFVDKVSSHSGAEFPWYDSWAVQCTTYCVAMTSEAPGYRIVVLLMMEVI